MSLLARRSFPAYVLFHRLEAGSLRQGLSVRSYSFCLYVFVKKRLCQEPALDFDSRTAGARAHGKGTQAPGGQAGQRSREGAHIPFSVCCVAYSTLRASRCAHCTNTAASWAALKLLTAAVSPDTSALLLPLLHAPACGWQHNALAHLWKWRVGINVLEIVLGFAQKDLGS